MKANFRWPFMRVSESQRVLSDVLPAAAKHATTMSRSWPKWTGSGVVRTADV